jgi:outer membrane protein TolC
MNKYLSILFLFALAALPARAGEPLTLRAALAEAERSGFDLAIARAERDAADADANASLSVFLPNIRLSSMATVTNDPLNVFGMKLRERRVTPADFNPALLNEPDRYTQYTTSFDVQQPIINLDGFLGRAAAIDGARAMAMKEERTRRYVAYRVKLAYFGLVVARESHSVVTASLEAAEANAAQTRQFLAEGLINKSDELFAEMRLLDVRSRQAEAAGAIRSAENALRTLLGRTDTSDLVTSDSLGLPDSFPSPVPVEEVNERRSDMRAMGYGVDAARGMLRMQQLKLLPSLNAFGSYSLNDQKMLGRQGSGWTIGAMLQWNILPGFGTIAGIQKASAALERAESELAAQRVRNRGDLDDAYHALETARTRLALARESLHQSEENARVLRERYATGIGKTTDLLNAEAALADARLGVARTLYACNAALFTIELLTEPSYSR